MKKLIFGLLTLLFAAPAQAQSTKATLNTEVTTNFPDNTTGLITPAILRTTVTDFIASWQQATRINAQTGTTYTFVVGDYGFLVTFSNATAIAAALPQATGSFATWNAYVKNSGAGTLTITPSTSTINGAATLVLATGQSAFIVSDGTNYQTWTSPATSVTCAALPALTGDVTTTAGSCATTYANIVGVAKGGTGVSLSATGGASQVLKQTSVGGNITVAQLNFTDLAGTLAAAQVATTTITGQTVNNSPSSTNDYFMYFSSVDNAVRRCTVGACTSAGVAGVSSLNGLTGGLTVTAGTGISITAGGTTITPALTAARQTLPTVQVFTSGSGTYTTPANVLWIKVTLAGGGGGGSGAGTTAGAGGSGVATTFGSAFLTGNGGTGAGAGATVGGAGGSATGGDVNFTGGAGKNGNSSIVGTQGGNGGNSVMFGGGGSGADPAGAIGAVVPNTGGGGGGGASAATTGARAGGGAGGSLTKIVGTPSATYAYAVGTAGAAGAAGTGGTAGGAGAAGIIIVEEHYGS